MIMVEVRHPCSDPNHTSRIVYIHRSEGRSSGKQFPSFERQEGPKRWTLNLTPHIVALNPKPCGDPEETWAFAQKFTLYTAAQVPATHRTISLPAYPTLLTGRRFRLWALGCWGFRIFRFWIQVWVNLTNKMNLHRRLGQQVYRSCGRDTEGRMLRCRVKGLE